MSLLQTIALAIVGGLGITFGVGGLLELVYYRRRRDRPDDWKCQPRRWAPARMRRDEILLGAANLTAASIGSGSFAYWIQHGGHRSTALYFDLTQHGLVFSVATAIAYFLLTDLGLYWAHRLYHRRTLFRWIHRWHHRWTSPTAFTAAAMHPVEFATYQVLMLAPLFVMPIHVYGLIAVLLYQNYVALIDHAGVRLHSWLPWQSPTQFHDDHHVYFHVNYAQNLGLWDRLFGTWRRQGRVYGEHVFGGKGAPLDGSDDGQPRYVDYGKKPRVAVEPTAVAAAADGDRA